MSRKVYGLLAACLLCLATTSTAFAEVQMNAKSGKVMVNSGVGYVPVTGPVALRKGDRVMVGSKSKGSITFDGDCTIPLPQNQIITIGSSNPCKAKALEGSTGIVVGVVAAAAVVAGVVILLNDDDKKTVSP